MKTDPVLTKAKSRWQTMAIQENDALTLRRQKSRLNSPKHADISGTASAVIHPLMNWRLPAFTAFHQPE